MSNPAGGASGAMVTMGPGARLLAAARGLDRGYLVVLVICLIAVWPFVSRPALPQATDAELHIFRLAELSRVVRGGELYPRWAPNLYYGFGYPIFNYYAPLVYYLGLVVDFLPLLGPVQAVKLLFVAGLLLAGLGMYGYARDLWGRPAGLTAAALFVYAPYVLYVDPHARGDLAESFSFGLFALSLWAMDRLRRRPGTTEWLAATLLVAGLILTHNLMALAFFGLLAGWTLWQAIGRRRLGGAVGAAAPSRLARARLGLALILGAGLAAFFWLVVALERDAVNLTTLIGPGGHFDFRNHFVELSELLGPARLLDWGATEPDFALNVGVAQWVLALVGISVVITGRVVARWQAAFVAVALAVLLFLLTPASTALWESVPLLPYLQFPWRLLGPIAALTAVLGGVAVAGLQPMLPSRVGRWLPAAAIALTIGLALPLSMVPPWPEEFGPTTALRVLHEELEGRWLGTTSTADFVPVTVEVVPRPQPALLEEYERGRPVTRLNQAALPEGATVQTEILTPLRFRYSVSSPEAFPLRLFIHDFPGWRATVDGRTVATELGRPEGFLVVPVPAGDHVVEVAFRSTPARRLAAGISLLSLIAIAAVAARLGRGRAGELAPSTPQRLGPVSLAILIVAAALFLVRATILETQGLLYVKSEGDRALPAQVDIYADFGRQIALIGYDLAAQVWQPGETINLTLYWKAQQSLQINYQVFAHLQAADGRLLAQSDKLNPGDFPTKQWPLDRYVRDEHEITLPADLPAGQYRLSVGLWVSGDGWRVPLLDKHGFQLGDHYVIERAVEVAPPD